MSSAIELRHLRYFIAVAEALSFGKAAGHLGITQPSLSLQVQALEKEVGARLLERRPRVRLTEAGSALLATAKRVLAEVEDGVESVRRVARGEVGTLRFGVVASTLLVPSLPEGIRRFREQYRGVEFQLREMSTVDLLEALRSERIDIALLREPPPDREFSHAVVARERLMAVLPATHPLASGAGVSLAALEKVPFIFFPRRVNPQLHDRFFHVFREAGYVPDVVQEASEFQTCVSLVATGLGITVVPAGIRRIQIRGVVYQPLEVSDATTSIVLCWRNYDASPRVSALVDLMRSHENALRPSDDGAAAEFVAGFDFD